jgi:ABC-type branched-subunit amino acid transport system substrate-binding protein
MAEAARNGQQIVSVTSYPYSFRGVQESVGGAAPQIAALSPDAVLVTDEREPLVAVLSFLALGDVRSDTTQLLGLKRWEEGNALRSPELRGGWFPAVDPSSIADFEARFQARYGRTPLRDAITAYDAVAAIAQLVGAAARAGDATPFTAAALTAASGFEGGSGRFRLNADGTITRALAIMEVGAGGPVLRAPAEAPGS